MFVLAAEANCGAMALANIRDISTQIHRPMFKDSLERIGALLAYEISKTLTYIPQIITTPLGSKTVNKLAIQPVVVTVLRAGLPLYNGVIQMLPDADSAFIGAYRAPHAANEDIEVEMHYNACPDIEGRDLIIADTMLATGKSLVQTYDVLIKNGVPKSIHFVSAIASADGIAYVQKHVPHAYLWLGDIDETLNNMKYIVPGLGDAGDLAFGPKR